MNIFEKIKARSERKQALWAAHEEALAATVKYYNQVKHLENVNDQWDGDGYVAYSSASPERAAWDMYFDEMRDRGQSAWDIGPDRFDRELLKAAGGHEKD